MAAKLFTPSKLMTAIRAGRLDDVINTIAEGADIEEADMHGFIGLPLRTACFDGNLEIVRELLQRGASVNAVAGDGPGAPLRLAQRGQHQEIITLLLAHGAATQPVAEPPLSSATRREEVPPSPPGENRPTGAPSPIEQAVAVRPDKHIESTRPLPDEINDSDIEEYDLTAVYGVDTNLLTLDLMRENEAEIAATARSLAPPDKKPAKNETSGFWKRRSND